MPAIVRRFPGLRIPEEDATWRIVYRVDADAIVVAKVFAKKTQATPKAVVYACQRTAQLPVRCGREGASEMDKAKHDRLAAAGWHSGDAADFLELTEEEAASPQPWSRSTHACIA